MPILNLHFLSLRFVTSCDLKYMPRHPCPQRLRSWLFSASYQQDNSSLLPLVYDINNWPRHLLCKLMSRMLGHYPGGSPCNLPHKVYFLLLSLSQHFPLSSCTSRSLKSAAHNPPVSPSRLADEVTAARVSGSNRSID